MPLLLLLCVWRLSGSRFDQLVAIYLEFYILQSSTERTVGVREMRAYSSNNNNNNSGINEGQL